MTLATTQKGVSAETLRSISTPDVIESRLGRLTFNDGAPSPETAALLYDNLDLIHGVEAFINSFPGASTAAVREGFQSIGATDNKVLIFSDLMDSASLFLTANCDTVYFVGYIDLSNGPMVLDIPAIPAPSGILGTIDDMWFRWVTDFGLPGPDRGEGGRYLIVGPGYDGPLPDSGFHVSHSRTTRALLLGRAFMVDNDPAIPVKAIREGVHISPYAPGGLGTSVGTFLAGKAPLAPLAKVAETEFVEGSGVAFNTIPPNDFGYWGLIDSLVQQEPASAGDPEVYGLLASIGIVKGKPFAPDARMRKILEEAAAIGNATSRTVAFAPRPEEGFAYYEDSGWLNPIFVGGYEFMDPPPRLTAKGLVPAVSDGARKLNSRTAWFYPYTGVTPAMCMYLTGLGSQYLMAMRGADGEFLDGARTYTITLPAGIPESRFWSVMLYDRQTRSMLQTSQPKPDIGSQRGTLQTEADGSTVIHIGPTAPAGRDANWLQTDPDKGFFALLRLYNPLEPFFDKSWRPSEIEPV